MMFFFSFFFDGGQAAQGCGEAGFWINQIYNAAIVGRQALHPHLADCANVANPVYNKRHAEWRRGPPAVFFEHRRRMRTRASSRVLTHTDTQTYRDTHTQTAGTSRRRAEQKGPLTKSRAARGAG